MRRRRRGQSIIETVVGIIFLIPLVLFLLDVSVLVMAQTANDNLAKSAARAAASATNGPGGLGNSTVARAAADRVLNDFALSSIITTKRIPPNGFLYDTSSPGNVIVETRIDVRPPVAFPGFTVFNFRARATEPIVALPPTAAGS
jgi:Flp pilus assembly protein TadG